jgi:ParB-like chromosome segregation protein Spo0J
MKIKLKELKPNPYRNIDHYPIRKEKVIALRESFRATGGVWPNIVVRKNGGGVEQAYGHHRAVAAREEFGPNHEIEVIDRKLDDAMMLKMMAHDNMEEYGTSAIVVMETVKAVVEAFAAGRIKLENPAGAGRGGRRIAPSFKQQEGIFGEVENSYNAGTIGKLIGWMETETKAAGKIYIALDALELIEKGVLKEKDFYELSLGQAEVLVKETNATLAWREESKHTPTREQAVPKARAVGTAIAKSFRQQKERGSAGDRAARIVDKIEKRPKRLPDVAEFCLKLSRELGEILSPRDELTEMILEIIKVVDDVDERNRKGLIADLESLSNRAKQLAGMVKSGKGIPRREVHQLLNRS